MKTLLRILALACAVVPFVPARASDTPKKKVLVVTVTTGFRHSSIPVAEKILADLAARSGQFTVDYVRQPEGLPKGPTRPRPGPAGDKDPAHVEAMKKFAAEEAAYDAQVKPQFQAALAKLSPANLKQYDAVIFASTTGDLPLPDKQGFVDWIASGKAFIGVHAAADTFHKSGKHAGFPPFVTMIGGAFRTHGPQVTVECINRDPSHAACAAVPAKWTVFDEIYEFKEHDPAKVRHLLALDKHPQTKAPGHNSVAWCKQYGKGRVFYTSLGHREDVWDPVYTDKDGRKNSPEIAKQFQEHLLGGILWALGLAKGDATPNGI